MAIEDGRLAMPDKQIIIIAGPNGAGKTTFAREFLPREENFETFINADLIAAGLNPFNPSRAAIQAGRLMLKAINQLVERGESFAFETTLSGLGYSRSIPRWQERGYRVKLIFLRLESADAALNRVGLRVSEGGHDIPDEVIGRRFERGWRNFESVYRDLVDEWMVYNNQSRSAIPIAKGGKGTMTMQETKIQTETARERDEFAARVEAALHRAALRAWARAARHGGKVAVVEDGKVVLLDPTKEPPPTKHE